MSDGIVVVEYRREDGQKRRVRFEPTDGGRDRIDEVWVDGEYRVCGHETVTSFELEAPAAVVSDRFPRTDRGP